ncbi:protein of unknown function [Methylotuvimicrobium alcaliphilum 20Z]|uniref:Uncharacterized protein n=1 Tax=Methylotuvimicrobium alcaliphilum (strain DSM 19304 / NCIMB 14124 / VKM B-2133 / 20Z) TaxID=1091494 RepID=G4T3R9_META2|nr:protein of unknown function [Methylotuvimicrobium alcaliphilum 20Z]
MCSKGFPSMELARAYRDVFTQHLNSIAHWAWLIVLDNLGAGVTAPFDGHPGAEFRLAMSILGSENFAGFAKLFS